MHFSSKKKKTLQPGMSALNKAKECYRHPIFFAGFFGEFTSKGKFYWITNAFLEVSKCISFPPLRMGVKYLPHLSLYATAIERIIVVLGTTSLNFYTKWHVVSKGIRFLAFLKKFVKERKRCVCFRIIHFSPKNLLV